MRVERLGWFSETGPRSSYRKAKTTPDGMRAYRYRNALFARKQAMTEQATSTA